MATRKTAPKLTTDQRVLQTLNAIANSRGHVVVFTEVNSKKDPALLTGKTADVKEAVSVLLPLVNAIERSDKRLVCNGLTEAGRQRLLRSLSATEKRQFFEREMEAIKTRLHPLGQEVDSLVAVVRRCVADLHTELSSLTDKLRATERELQSIGSNEGEDRTGREPSSGLSLVELARAWKTAADPQKAELAAKLANCGAARLGVPNERIPYDKARHNPIKPIPSFGDFDVRIVEPGWLQNSGNAENILLRADVVPVL